ncbi:MULTISPECIES: hypothetical protein [Rhodococcus]|uniref:hypothetical protein n=1 Tax=Rhodococcus TaxID=1827 RepID=UPI000B07CE2F|nr:hypothetical protein [Rhodococcus globerulus]
MPKIDEIDIPKYPPGLKARGKRLWVEMHTSGDFSGSPETVSVIEEACYLADEIKRLRDIVRKAGSDTRVTGYNGQSVSMPEMADLQRNQQLLLSMLKSIRVDSDDAKLTPSQLGRLGADARWDKR